LGINVKKGGGEGGYCFLGKTHEGIILQRRRGELKNRRLSKRSLERGVHRHGFLPKQGERRRKALPREAQKPWPLPGGKVGGRIEKKKKATRLTSFGGVGGGGGEKMCRSANGWDKNV